MSKNIYKQATRLQLRFSSELGELSVYDLWDLPLTSKRSISLNSLAQGIHRQKETELKNFVDDQSEESSLLELKLNLVKDIIETKKAENKAKETRKEISQLETLLKQKRQDKIKEMSEDDLSAKIKEMRENL